MQAHFIPDGAPFEPLPRSLTWVVSCLLLCPAAIFTILSLGDSGPGWQSAPSAHLTVSLGAQVDSLGIARARFDEWIGLALTVGVAAAPPSVCVVLFKDGWVDVARSAAEVFPAVFVTLLAPTLVVYSFASDLSPLSHGFGLAYAFVVVLSAWVTAIAIAYSLWHGLRPERNDGWRPH